MVIDTGESVYTKYEMTLISASILYNIILDFTLKEIVFIGFFETKGDIIDVAFFGEQMLVFEFNGNI